MTQTKGRSSTGRGSLVSVFLGPSEKQHRLKESEPRYPQRRREPPNPSDGPSKVPTERGPSLRLLQELVVPITSGGLCRPDRPRGSPYTGSLFLLDESVSLRPRPDLLSPGE